MILCLQTVYSGSFLLETYLRTDALGSASYSHSVWIQYTQTELHNVRADLQHRHEEDLAIRRTQQAQLESLQVQVREWGQQQSELSEQRTQIASAITDLFHQLGEVHL